MSIGPTQYAINPVHLVTPDRVVAPAPNPFDAPPGVVPFYRALEAENLAHPNRVEIPRQRDTFEPIAHRPAPARSSIHLLPTLGEVLPVVPFAPASIKIEQTRQVQIPATGRVLDLYI